MTSFNRIPHYHFSALKKILKPSLLCVGGYVNLSLLAVCSQKGLPFILIVCPLGFAVEVSVK